MTRNRLVPKFGTGRIVVGRPWNHPLDRLRLQESRHVLVEGRGRQRRPVAGVPLERQVEGVRPCRIQLRVAAACRAGRLVERDAAVQGSAGRPAHGLAGAEPEHHRLAHVETQVGARQHVVVAAAEGLVLDRAHAARTRDDIECGVLLGSNVAYADIAAPPVAPEVGAQVARGDGLRGAEVPVRLHDEPPLVVARRVGRVEVAVDEPEQGVGTAQAARMGREVRGDVAYATAVDVGEGNHAIEVGVHGAPEPAERRNDPHAAAVVVARPKLEPRRFLIGPAEPAVDRFEEFAVEVVAQVGAHGDFLVVVVDRVAESDQAAAAVVGSGVRQVEPVGDVVARDPAGEVAMEHHAVVADAGEVLPVLLERLADADAAGKIPRTGDTAAARDHAPRRGLVRQRFAVALDLRREAAREDGSRRADGRIHVASRIRAARTGTGKPTAVPIQIERGTKRRQVEFRRVGGTHPHAAQETAAVAVLVQCLEPDVARREVGVRGSVAVRVLTGPAGASEEKLLADRTRRSAVAQKRAEAFVRGHRHPGARHPRVDVPRTIVPSALDGEADPLFRIEWIQDREVHGAAERPFDLVGGRRLRDGYPGEQAGRNELQHRIRAFVRSRVAAGRIDDGEAVQFEPIRGQAAHGDTGAFAVAPLQLHAVDPLQRLRHVLVGQTAYVLGGYGVGDLIGAPLQRESRR